MKQILEIGQAEGYTSYYLATAAKENNGTYLAIDIVDTWNRPHEPFGYSLKRAFEGECLPARFLKADTKQMDKLPDFKDGGLDSIDLAFIDGEHKTDTILHEVYDLILPKLRKDGWGFIMFDDVIDMGAEGAWEVICKDKQFESLTIHPNGGFGMTRLKKCSTL
jgi:predicted O-methyltransferase YrrM